MYVGIRDHALLTKFEFKDKIRIVTKIWMISLVGWYDTHLCTVDTYPCVAFRRQNKKKHFNLISHYILTLVAWTKCEKRELKIRTSKMSHQSSEKPQPSEDCNILYKPFRQGDNVNLSLWIIEVLFNYWTSS